jgi:hypothetical protein
MWITGWMLMFVGAMLLIGEYLCVEVAWRCLDYNKTYVTVGGVFLGLGLIVSLLGTIEERER